jgi:hypothetical protein
MINSRLKGRACIESVRGSFEFCELFLFLSFSLLFFGAFCIFLSSSLPFWLGLPVFVFLLTLQLFSFFR